MPRIKRALISVSDKTNVVWFARELESMGVEIISTGGTYKLLSQNDIGALPVAEVTGSPEMLDGRVKTLHPKIHGGILADRDKPEHMRQLDYQKIPQIDLVAVNLYPFAQTISRPNVKREEAIEQIDIGGPTMVRAAAKNHAHVAVVVNPARYKGLIEEMKESGGQVSDTTRQELALEAFAHTAEYDAMISSYLAGEEERKRGFPHILSFGLQKVRELRYGENPHQSAALYSEWGTKGTIPGARQVHGSELSFNNMMDGEAAWWTVQEFDDPAAVLIKHNNPCGVAVADGLTEAYRKAFECDPLSAFGSVVAFNRRMDLETAEAVTENFVELILVPSFEEDALEFLVGSSNARLLEMGDGKEKSAGKDYRRILGGLLVQDYDSDTYDRDSMKVVTEKSPGEKEWDDLLFAMRVCKHVKSNAIVFARNLATVGIGAGQMSRVDSVIIAARKAGEKAQGAVMASDAFFPFSDGVEKAAEAGIGAVIQPGGSVRDDQVIATCDEHRISMVFTHRRHFLH